MPDSKQDTNEAMGPKMDWRQVEMNGGPPCFAELPNEPGTFCGRAKRWGGHGTQHLFISASEYAVGVLGGLPLTTADHDKMLAAIEMMEESYD